MDGSDLQKSHKYPFYPRDSKIFSDEGFVILDNGFQGGTHWTCFYIIDNKSYYFDLFVGQPDKLLSNHLPKPIIYHNHKIQDFNSNCFGSFCLYFFYFIERMNYYDAILKIIFINLKMADKCIW